MSKKEQVESSPAQPIVGGICTYDNPATMSRECWQDGKLLCHYQAHLFAIKPFPVPRELFFFGADIGPWEKGRMVGDKAAMLPQRKRICRRTTTWNNESDFLRSRWIILLD